MHKLDRNKATIPDKLDNYDYLVHSWDNLSSDDKDQLKNSLKEMQGNWSFVMGDEIPSEVRCAYCECIIRKDRHIEHFRRKNKNHYPELTFNWENLFFSCGTKAHCGHYKDRNGAPAYDPNNLIKPDIHEPDNYLYFHSTGKVRCKTDLSKEERIIAEETIKVFGLNNSALMAERKSALKSYKKIFMEDFEVLSQFPTDEIIAYIDEEIHKTKYVAYSTTIKHFLQGA